MLGDYNYWLLEGSAMPTTDGRIPPENVNKLLVGQTIETVVLIGGYRIEINLKNGVKFTVDAEFCRDYAKLVANLTRTETIKVM